MQLAPLGSRKHIEEAVVKILNVEESCRFGTLGRCACLAGAGARVAQRRNVVELELVLAGFQN